MEHNGTWGTDVELLTFANLCQTNVYVYNTECYTWIVYPLAFQCPILMYQQSLYTYFIQLIILMFVCFVRKVASSDLQEPM